MCCSKAAIFAAAREQYQAAVASKGDLAEAHQGLARTLEQMGECGAAEPHWQLGFAGHAVVKQRYRGAAAPFRHCYWYPSSPEIFRPARFWTGSGVRDRGDIRGILRLG
jgi:hypothetical protein